MTATDTLNVRTVTVALDINHPDMGSITLTSAVNSIGDTYWIAASDTDAARYYTGDPAATGVIGSLSWVPGRGWYVYATQTGELDGEYWVLPAGRSRAHAGRMLMAWWNHLARIERDEPGTNLRAVSAFDLPAKTRKNLFR